MAPAPDTDLFRQRARAEAARYGSDSWVFVRELLQNARDAGASRIEIEVSNHGEHERVTCRDDGCGMSYEHARRYLFALYASSKEDDREQAGKFGIGFWSVLRFAPSTITIRSRSGRGDAWQVSLDGGLGSVEETRADLEAGTEIVLERPARDGDLAAEVMAATRHYGRFITRRDDPETPLPVTVDGGSANAELKLEAPSATFSGKGFRGAVGLGAEPKVELFAQGLFVRSANSLQDLQAAGELSDDADATTEDVLAELPSMAPRVLIDSAELDLLLARSDARYDKHLRRILRTAEKQLSRLISRQLQALRPQPFYRVWWGALRDWLEPHLGGRLAAAGVAGLVLGLIGLWSLSSGWLTLPDALRRGRVTAGPGALDGIAAEAEDTADPIAGLSTTDRRTVVSRGGSPDGAPWLTGPFAPGSSSSQPGSGTSARPGLEVHAYVDLADRYRGPRPGGLAGDSSRLAMVYEPIDATPFFAALRIDELSATRWAPSSVDDRRRYRGAVCRRDCLEARLLVAEGQRTVRIPVPTGHRLDAASVRFGGEPVEIHETASGEALLRSNGRPGVVEYRTGPARPPAGGRPAPPPPDAPAELIRVARDLRRLPVEERVQRALDYVVERVVYDRSPAAWGQHSRLASEGRSGFVEIALDTGAGDCDVQSGVLVTLLRLAGVEARLALGYVGIRGTVAPGLHAWVEVRDPEGVWTIVDPSVTTASDGRLQRAGSGAPLLPADLAGARFPSQVAGSPLPPAAPLAVVALLLGAVAWLLRHRSAAGIELLRLPAFGGTSGDENLAALLGGALRHPEAFAGQPAMFHGRFVPLLGREGGPGKYHPGGEQTKYISLARARRMASKNRLFRAGTGSELARRAVARGVPVIDASSAEGRVLSLALGAIDVDHWSNLLSRGSTSELSRRINSRLDGLGAFFRLREASGLTEPWVEIALEHLKLGERQVLVDPSHLEYAPVRALIADHPEAAAFTMLDVLLHRIELPDRERSRLLAAFARQAVDEAAVTPPPAGARETSSPEDRG